MKTNQRILSMLIKIFLRQSIDIQTFKWSLQLIITVLRTNMKPDIFKKEIVFILFYKNNQTNICC